jgi:hypothetical protein
MSKLSRTKGAGGERELCKILSDALGEKITRKLGQARDGGHDVELSPFRIECKRRKVLAIYDWWSQVLASCEKNHTPVVAMRADGEEWLVVMRLNDWIKLAREEIAK